MKFSQSLKQIWDNLELITVSLKDQCFHLTQANVVVIVFCYRGGIIPSKYSSESSISLLKESSRTMIIGMTKNKLLYSSKPHYHSNEVLEYKLFSKHR